MPSQINGVAVDLLSPEAGEDFLEATLAAPPGTMMEAAPLIYMKLKSPRRKDQVDVIEMIKGGIDAKQCREYLVAHAPAFVDAFDESLRQAESEQDWSATPKQLSNGATTVFHVTLFTFSAIKRSASRCV